MVVTMKVIDDLIIMGRAGPERINDDDGETRHTICTAGYSPTEGWVRLYPTQKRMSELRRWNIVRVPVQEEITDDHRDESYKIVGSKEDWNILHTKVEKVGRLGVEERIQLVDELGHQCTEHLCDDRRSLGIAEPEQIHNVYLSPNGKQKDPKIEETALPAKNDYPYKLYIKYNCKNCGVKTVHEQSCIEWGVYRYWDTNNDDRGVVDALNVLDSDYKTYFLVGNQAHQLTSYLIISILRFKKSDCLDAGVRVGNQRGLSSFSAVTGD
jgi:hypothetical protein